MPRGTRPDAESFDRLVLAKHVSLLRATYQIRLLTLRAVHEGKRLVILVPDHCKVHRTLRSLAKQVPKTIRIDRTS